MTPRLPLPLALAAALACGLPGCRKSADRAAERDLSARVAVHLSALGSADPAARADAADALVRIGPEALFGLCPFVRQHLHDADERAWRAGYEVEERIALRYQDDPRLDDYYRSLKPVRLPVKTFTLDDAGGVPNAIHRVGVPVTMEFVRVPPGTFIQGSANPGTGVPMAEDMPCTYAPVRKVTLTRAFWVGRDEVTQAQWQAVMGFNRSREQRPHLAVERVSWDEAVEFCRRLSERFPPHRFSLPTEAQWEYACRAGTTARHAFGNRSLYRGDPRLAEGGAFHENRWGLRHMHDRVFEWCLDFYGPYTTAPATDPTGPLSGAERSIRSNYTYCSASEVRCAHRVGFPPGPRHGIGLRCVFPAD